MGWMHHQHKVCDEGDVYIEFSHVCSDASFLTSAIKELEPRQFRMQQGINLQAIANSHVTLIAVKLLTNGFERYRRYLLAGL